MCDIIHHKLKKKKNKEKYEISFGQILYLVATFFKNNIWKKFIKMLQKKKKQMAGVLNFAKEI